MSEIRKFKLSAEFLALAACNTQKFTNEDTRFGGDTHGSIASAFLIAGANQVAATHWKVGNLSSKKLMEHLFDQILKHAEESIDSRRSSAKQISSAKYARWLHQAQKKTRDTEKVGKSEGYGHPFHWGAYSMQRIAPGK